MGRCNRQGDSRIELPGLSSVVPGARRLSTALLGLEATPPRRSARLHSWWPRVRRCKSRWSRTRVRHRLEAPSSCESSCEYFPLSS
jgi:hypothetical protein